MAGVLLFLKLARCQIITSSKLFDDKKDNKHLDFFLSVANIIQMIRF
jgi:hypothetical protein